MAAPKKPVTTKVAKPAPRPRKPAKAKKAVGPKTLAAGAAIGSAAIAAALLYMTRKKKPGAKD